MHELVGDFTTLLQAALTCPVAKYQRISPPTALRVQVIEGEESAEHANDLNQVSGGTHFQRMGVVCIVEAPWDEKGTTAATLDATVESIKAEIWKTTGRTIDGSDGIDADVGRYDGSVPFFTQYPGQTDSWVKGRYVSASWRV